MKEFSQLIPEDRKFELGGEVWEWETPHWEALAAIFDEDVQILTANLEEDEEQQKDETPKDETPTKDSIARVQDRIALFLPAADRPRWKKLCQRKENPVPMFLFSEVYRWLLEVATGRPTQPPSDSESGGGNGEVSSPAGSRSRAGSRKR